MSRKSEKLKEIAENNGWKFHPDYSGRFMFNALCCGISGPSSTEIIEECASKGIRGSTIDQLGKGHIVYFKAIKE